MMSCHIPLEELRRLQRRSTDASAPVLTTPAAPEDAPGEVTVRRPWRPPRPATAAASRQSSGGRRTETDRGPTALASAPRGSVPPSAACPTATIDETPCAS